MSVPAPPASFVQEQLWFLDQMDPGSATYNIAAIFGLQGPLDEALLRQSLQEVVNRHGALRTTFAVVDGEPFQIVAPRLALSMPVIELGDVPPTEREARARHLAAEEGRRPFDLARGPLVRAMLLRLGEEERMLLLTLHHTVADGWSLGILAREVSAIYRALLAREPSPPPPLPLQYADFAREQRASLAGAALDAGLAYWTKVLGSDRPLVSLAPDRPRPPVQTFRGAAESLTLPGSLCDALRSLSRRERVTLFMTMLGAFQALLHRYTGERVITVGSPASGRPSARLEEVIGCFLNTLILRTDLSGDPTFSELLGRVREATLQAFEHQDIPFERIVEALQPERDRSRSPFVQVLFNWLSFPMSPLDLPGVTVTMPDLPEVGSKFDLTLYAGERDGAIDVKAVYNADLFDAATVGRLLGHLGTLLEAIAADPERRLSALPLLTPAERRRLLVEWNDTRADYPETACLDTLVETQVARTPDAVAVVASDGCLTYRELFAQASGLARLLRQRGVRGETRVGIFLERSPELIVSLLAVLKAGGAYVALDPVYPGERLAFMLADARPALLLTQKGLLARLPAWSGPILCVDGDDARLAGEEEPEPAPVSDPDRCCYVAYTSGSMGRPNGVLATHRGVVNYLTYLLETYDLGPADTVLQLTNVSFDPSVREIFGSLAAGARLVLLSDHEAQDPRAVLARIRERRVTAIVAIVPTMLRALVAAADDERLTADSVRILLVSGEPPTAADCRAVRRIIAPGALVVNQYGPTECTMTSTYHRVGPADEARGMIPAGRPIANTRLYVLNQALEPVPIGVAGEVCIGGVGVARGYLDRPELTAERFVPDPWSDAPGARLYRTGDMGRYLVDGTLELLGRLDDQVKVRGVRVELGEVESALAEHPAVGAAAVTLRAEPSRGPGLVAYFVSRGAQVPDERELRSFLANRLPAYMVPAEFVSLEALPLTPNGKVDRRALPAPDRPPAARVFVAPRTPIESALAGIWADLLGRAEVGAHDDFFELGGHSLLAARLLSRVRRRFRVELSLGVLFDSPTVAGLASAVVEALAAEVEPEAMARVLGEVAGLPEEEAQRRQDERRDGIAGGAP